MHIIQIATELAPIAKVGGLGDVIFGLSQELHRKKQEVEIILPKYDCLDLNQVDQLEVAMRDLFSFFRSSWIHNTVWKGKVNNLTVYFIESHDPHHYFNRGKIYGVNDDIDRFIYFSRVALEFLFQAKKSPQLLHIHDWPTSLIAPLYCDLYRPTGFPQTKIVLTIHNLEHQGRCNPKHIEDVGLPKDHYHRLDRLQDDQSKGDINLLKGGIVYADFVTTVSPNYAKEALTPFAGKGLENILNHNKGKFCGILNGIDEAYWNPATDPLLPLHYSFADLDLAAHTHPFLPKKRLIQDHLRKVLSLNCKENKPIISCITCLVSQKSPQLIKEALFHTLAHHGQFILLGSSADAETQEQFLTLKDQFSCCSDVHIELSFHEQLSHLVYAGSDLIVVPSLFEPCGLTQMIALGYGTIPLVRATGGLADTIHDIDYSELPIAQRNGFTFMEPSKDALIKALDRAFNCWLTDPQTWRRLMHNSLQSNFSWHAPCNEYLAIYEKILGEENRSQPSFSLLPRSI